ncbi:MAG TPA: peptidoglycan DD-metalloendopeptidase family protein, partial [Actinomycetota bacterium]|nr:peptidoglycan DD-metalloendopeptidase family protein [Actinomycetota bacterium]
MSRAVVRTGLVLIATVISASADPAAATDGDVYAEGTRYCATTYSPGHDTPKGFGPPIDLNAAGGDLGRPVRAPTAGTVSVFSRAGIYGLSVVWRSADGMERLHVAHLSRIVARGEVRAGQLIGRGGNTGHSVGEGHLHMARQVGGRPAPMILSGTSIRPDRCYTSAGPIRQRCLDADATMVGTPRADHLVGTAGADVFAPGAGADVVRGGGGDDVICGQGGADVLRGGAGTDRISGGEANDRLEGNDGDDALDGDGGADLADGGPGIDTCLEAE